MSRTSALTFFGQTLDGRYGGFAGVGAMGHNLLHGLNLLTDVRLLSLPPAARSRFLAEQAAALRIEPGQHVFFPNYYVPPLGLKRNPKTVVVHDTLFRDRPETVSPAKRAWMQLALGSLLRRADIVIFISEYTRNQFDMHFGIGNMNSHVVHNPIDEHAFAFRDPELNSFAKPRIATVSAYYPHKNFATYCRIAKLVGDDAEFVAIGRPPSRDQLKVLADEIGAETLAAVNFTGYLPRHEMINLVAECDAFLFPSLYEGFGMPPVEAVALGVPTLCADIPAVREVLGDMTRYVGEATDAAAWKAELTRLLGSPPSREKRAKWSTAVRNKLSRRNTASNYLDAMGITPRIEVANASFRGQASPEGPSRP